MRPRRRVSVCSPYHLNERKTFSKEFDIAFGLDDDGGDTTPTRIAIQRRILILTLLVLLLLSLLTTMLVVHVDVLVWIISYWP
jgi:hypothetical protein